MNFPHSRAYYFNNTGSDANDGSITNPFKSIEKLNTLQLTPGDTVFFEGGQTFKGSIYIDSNDAGKKDQPVVITSSGPGRATICGDALTALTLHRSGFIQVSNLKLEGSGRKQGNTKDGIIVNECNNVRLDSLSIKGFQKAGLLVYSSTGVDVSNVYATENGFAGISVSGAGKKTDCSNIRIRNCRAENNPGDPTNFTNHSGNGIIAGYCKNVTIEYCTATNNGWDMPRKGNGPVGIWCYEADSVIIQHCISYKNKTARGAADGGGFDFDGGVTNSVIQYCLSYENEGSAFGLFQYAGAGNWYNNTIRYCISENDGSVSAAQAGVFVWNSSDDPAQLKDCYFYNNTIYNTKGAAVSYEAQSLHSSFHFYNNIFVSKDSLMLGKNTGSHFTGNNWYSLKDGFNINGVRTLQEWAAKSKEEMYNGKLAGLNINPQFDNTETDITNPDSLKYFNKYRLPSSSALRMGGIHLQQAFNINNGGKAFNQNDAPENGIGACF
ncbi:MAG: right-handed parallel beta-helix repeat-containing protein [Chitinophagaceae bacterium]|nr:right-handed parallel beta-helix repeat-containing protein [Chitinophagaceae bacterium]